MKKLSFTVLLLTIVSYSQAQTTIWSDNFELSGVRPSSNNGGIGFPAYAYFQRTNGSDIDLSFSAYSGQEGSFFWAGEDHDGYLGLGNEIQEITYTNINISGKTNLSFKGLFAANNQAAAFENSMLGYSHSDYIIVEYSIDGSSYQPIIQFYSNNNIASGINNKSLAEDTNNDGIGDGNILTTNFTEFTKYIPGSGSSMSVKVRCYTNSSNEELAFDNFRVLGDNACNLSASIIAQTNLSCNGSGNGSITVQATNGSTNYSYAWSNGFGTSNTTSATNTNTGLYAGTYTVTITDGNSCTATASSTVTQPSLLQATTVINSNVSCNGGSDGAATASGTGGAMPYTYSWSNGATTASITGVWAGTYNVTITDDNGCIATNSATVTQPANLQVNVNLDSAITCYGDSNGGLTASVSGGTAGYIYNWSNGETTASITGLSEDYYEVTVTDANGCSSNNYEFIDPQVGINVYIEVDSLVKYCPSSSEAYLYAYTDINPYQQGGPNLSYIWNTLDTTETIHVTDTGMYSVTVTDQQSGCSQVDSFRFYFPEVRLVIREKQSINCFGDSTASLKAYFWVDIIDFFESVGMGGEGEGGQEGGQEGGPEGDYPPGWDTLTYLNAPDSALMMTTMFFNGFINNGNATSILWNTGDTLDSLSNLGAGHYIVEVPYDSSDFCIVSDTFEVKQPDAIQTTVSLEREACSNNQGGQASISASGGNSPYTYLWSNSTTSSYAYGLTTGKHYVTVTDSSGCTTIDSVDVTALDTLRVNIQIDSSINCYNDTNGILSAMVSGGQAPYNYYWSNQEDSSKIFGLGAGEYSVTVTDASGCSGSNTARDTVQLSEPSPLYLSIVEEDWISCPGAADAELRASTDGGMGLSYLWSRGDTTEIITGVDTGFYTVTVTDLNGCSETDGYYVYGPPEVTVDILLDSAVSCYGTNDAGLFADVSSNMGQLPPPPLEGEGNEFPEFQGGQEGLLPFPTDFLWSTGDTTENISGIGAGTYTVTITFGPGCTVADTFVVDEPDSLIASATADSVSCFGSFDGSANVSIIGGTTPYSILWSNGDTTAAINNLPAGNFSVTITDNNGCTTTANNTVTEPAMLSITTNVVQNASCQTATDGIVESNVSGGTTPYTYLWSDNSTNDSLFAGEGIYSITVTDANGCTAITSENILTIDTIKPTVLTQNINVYLDEFGIASIDSSDVDNGSSDACGIANIWLDSTSYDCSKVGQNTVTLYASDINGNIDSANAVVTVIDTIKPTVTTQDIDVYLDANGQASIMPSNIDNGSNDACGITSLSLDSTNFNCSETGTNTVWLIATDNNGNVDSAAAIVTVIDTVKPTVITQNIDLYLDASGQATITENDINNGSNDACGNLSLSLDSTNFDCSNVGANTVWLIAVDANGNTDSSSAVVTVIDTVKPTVITQNINLYLDASGQATITENDIDNGSSDACGNLALSLDSTNFDCSNIGQNTVWLRATDNEGNIDSASAIVTVIDTNKPTVITQNIDVYLDANGQASIMASDVDNGSSDVCSSITLSVDSMNFDCSEVGQNTVWLKATDNDGNTDSASAVVTVIDTIQPNVIAQDINLYLDASGQAAITENDIDNGSSDACGNLNLSLDSTNFDCSNIGQNTVWLRAADNEGNIDSASAIVTVIDTIKPTVITQNIDVYLDANGQASIMASDVDNGSSDVCSSITLSVDSMNFDCSEVGTNTVWLSATDNDGNTDSAVAIVTVIDTVKPTVITQNIDLYLDASGQTTITENDINNGSNDACGNLSLNLDSTNFDCSNVGANTVWLIAVDANGNTDSSSAVVSVIDTVRPTVITQNINLYLDANGQATITENDIDNGSSDACGNLVLDLDSTNFNCSNIGQNTVWLRATDNEGNADSASAVVTVIDTIKPTVITQNIDVYLDINGQASIMANDVDNGSSDVCSSISLSVDSMNFDCSEVGQNTVWLKATDNDGNTDSASAVVTVIDTIKPTVITQNTTVYLDANGQAAITTTAIDNGSTDNCSISTYSLSQENFACGDLGTQTVTLSITDVNGNVDSATATVTVLDTLTPQIISCPADIQLNVDAGSCTAFANWTAPTATDNCNLDSLVASHTSGSAFPIGITTVTYIAYDSEMNTDTCSFTVEVIDNESPQIASVPNNITVSNDSANCGAIVNWTAPTTSDNCSLDSLVSNYDSGEVFPVGTTTVQYIAFDQEMNTDTATFTITVNDDEKPLIQCINDTTICSSTFVYNEPDASDNCGVATVVRTSGIASGGNFPIGETTITYVVTDIHGNLDSCSFTVTRDEEPTIANAGQDQNICEDSIQLNANQAIVGNGSWSSTTSGVAFADANQANSMVALQQGENILVWTISNGVCQASSDTLIITYDEQPTVANAGTDFVLCEETESNLNANTPSVGTGNWSVARGSANFTNINDPLTSVNGLSADSGSFDGTNLLVWTITNGSCPVSSDTVEAKVSNNPIVNAGEDLEIYEDDGVQLSINSNIPLSTYQWSPVFSLSDASIANPFATPSENTLYTIVAATEDGCEGRDSIYVQVNKSLTIPTAFTPNNDGYNDVWEIKNLDQFESHKVVIYDGFGSEILSTSDYKAWDGKFNGEDLPLGSYYFVVETSRNGKTEAQSGTVSILR